MAKSDSQIRPRLAGSPPFVVRVTPEQRQDLIVEAQRQGVSPGDVLRAALETYFSLPEDMR